MIFSVKKKKNNLLIILLIITFLVFFSLSAFSSLLKKSFSASNLALKTIDGESFDSEKHKEKQVSDECTRVVIIELFLVSGCPPCSVVVPIIEQLAQTYGSSKVIVLEEHIWDSYEVSEITERYDWYIPLSDQGTPDVLFNGLNQRKQGIYFYNEYKNIVDIELAKEAKISIYAEKEVNNSTIILSGSIKNISFSTLNNLRIQGMIFEDRGEDELHHLVLDVLKEQEVKSFESEEIIKFTFTSKELNWLTENKVHGVIFVYSLDSSFKEILQAFFVE
jgi:thiol-disulfide isomerase/thioredoxin